MNLDWIDEGDGGEVDIVSGSAVLSGRLTLQTAPGRLRSGSVLVASGTTVEGVTASVQVRSGHSIDGFRRRENSCRRRSPGRRRTALLVYISLIDIVSQHD